MFPYRRIWDVYSAETWPCGPRHVGLSIEAAYNSVKVGATGASNTRWEARFQTKAVDMPEDD